MKVWNREKKDEAKKTDEQAVDHDPDNINEDEETDEHAVDYDPDDIDEEEDEETDEQAVDYDRDNIYEDEDEEFDEDDEFDEDEEFGEETVHYVPDDSYEEEDEEFDEETDGQIAQYNPQQAGMTLVPVFALPCFANVVSLVETVDAAAAADTKDYTSLKTNRVFFSFQVLLTQKHTNTRSLMMMMSQTTKR